MPRLVFTSLWRESKIYQKTNFSESLERARQSHHPPQNRDSLFFNFKLKAGHVLHAEGKTASGPPAWLRMHPPVISPSFLIQQLLTQTWSYKHFFYRDEQWAFKKPYNLMLWLFEKIQPALRLCLEKCGSSLDLHWLKIQIHLFAFWGQLPGDFRLCLLHHRVSDSPAIGQIASNAASDSLLQSVQNHNRS